MKTAIERRNMKHIRRVYKGKKHVLPLGINDSMVQTAHEDGYIYYPEVGNSFFIPDSALALARMNLGEIVNFE